MNVKVIAVDLDGTILEGGYLGRGKFGPIKPLAREVLNALWVWGYKIIIWTCRNDLGEVRDYLVEKKIPFDEINKNVKEVLDYWKEGGVDREPRKIYYDYLIDDRAGFDGDWSKIARQFAPKHTSDWMDARFEEVYEEAQEAHLLSLFQDGRREHPTSLGD